MTALGAGMMDIGIRNIVHVSLDTGIRQYDGVRCGYNEVEYRGDELGII